MPVTVPVYFDFACPWSYAARARERALAKDLGVRFEYLPWELAPDLPVEGDDNPYAEPGEELVAYAREAGVRVRTLPRRYNTHKALLGLFHARAHGRYDEYVDRVLHAVHEEQRNVGDEAVLRELARDAGLDDDAFVASVGSGAWAPYLAAVDALGEKLEVATTVTYLLPDGDGGLALHQGLGPLEETRAALKSALP